MKLIGRNRGKKKRNQNCNLSSTEFAQTIAASELTSYVNAPDVCVAFFTFFALLALVSFASPVLALLLFSGLLIARRFCPTSTRNLFYVPRISFLRFVLARRRLRTLHARFHRESIEIPRIVESSRRNSARIGLPRLGNTDFVRKTLPPFFRSIGLGFAISGSAMPGNWVSACVLLFGKTVS